MAESAEDLRAETTVYVVDDDFEVCESVDWLLESIGIRPVVCHSGEQFLDAYDGSRPACIVLDVRMPRMSGTRLQEKLNEFAPHVAIIFVSAHGDIRMSVSTLKAGALDFLEKPYDPQRLLDAVQAGVRRPASVSPITYCENRCGSRSRPSPRASARSWPWWSKVCPARTSPGNSA